MAKKKDDLTIQKIRQRLRAGGSPSQIARDLGVSRGLVLRQRARLERAVEDVGEIASSTAFPADLAEAIASVGGNSPMERLLITALNSLADDLEGAPIKSREGAARAIAVLIETQRKHFPLTMAEAAQWVVQLPGFSPTAFATALREAYADPSRAS